MKTFVKLFLVVSAVALLGAGCGKTTPPVNTSPTTPPVAAETVTVSYTSSGFSPSSVSLKVGDAIKFINNSTMDFWPASDPHPIHTGIPDLDAKRAIAPGGSYTFTFTKPVNAGWHNHLNTTQTGAIIVQ